MEESVKDSSPTEVVSGEIIISSFTKGFRHGTVHIRLEDVSYADERARLIVEKILPDIDHNPATLSGAEDTVVPFTIALTPEQATKIQPENDYVVRVWVAVNNDEKRSADNLYSTEQYRILTRGFGNRVSIHVAPRDATKKR
jgi:hypothetical protein